MNNSEMVQHIKDTYPVGCRVKLVEMNDPYAARLIGTLGTVRCVDDIGTVHVAWDCGSSLGVIAGIDRIVRV